MKTDGKYRIEIDGLPEISFDRIEPDAAKEPDLSVGPLEIVTLEAPNLTVDARCNQALADWYNDALNTEPTREPRGILTMGVEAWELGECEFGPPVPMPDGSYEMTVSHMRRFHGYCFDCPFCGVAVEPRDAPCHGAKIADSIQCPACGMTPTFSMLEGRRDLLIMTRWCSHCLTPRVFKDEEIYDTDAAQCPHCGLVNLLKEV